MGMHVWRKRERHIEMHLNPLSLLLLAEQLLCLQVIEYWT